MSQTNNKVEREVEKHVLTQTKKLSDETYEKIFSRDVRNESGYFNYNCHICSVAGLSGEKALQTHITGRKHQQKLACDFIPNADQFRSMIAPDVKAKSLICSGEPNPPGIEDVPSFLETIGLKHSKPLIGVEYVIELVDNHVSTPTFVCTLCDKRCDPRSILQQLVSHRHRMKYLETHFPSVIRVLDRDHTFQVDMAYREEILSKIAKTIETKFKQNKPYVCEYLRYESMKSQVTEETKKRKHFCKEDWPGCERALLDLIKASSTRREARELEMVSSESENEMLGPNSSSESVKRTMPIQPSVIRTKVSQEYNQRPKILSPWELQEQTNARMQEKYVIEKYRASVEIGVKELEKNLKGYEKCPESHPLYSNEWKAFWSRRFKEITAQGKNANDYDYKPEWIAFWTKRMKQLHDANIEKIKIDWRKKLNLKHEAVEELEKSLVLESRKKSQSRSPIRSKKRRSISHETISDDSDNDFGHEDKKSRHAYRKRSRSRYSDDYRPRDAYERFMSTEPSEVVFKARSVSPDMVDDVSLISVCRLLSALEDELGLLASKIIDLLGKAVALEKSKPNSADDLLSCPENVNTLETAREKLKGVLSANLIPTNKIIGVKRGIQNITALLLEFATRGPAKAVKSPFSSLINRPAESDQSSIHPAKLEVAKVIMESLIAQGRTNVPDDELEALIESFISSATSGDEEEQQLNTDDLEPKPEVKVVTENIPPTSSQKAKESNLENLTDEDLQTLLRNFADLTSDEQSHLIAYLSKIEQSNPARVEKLRKYVNIGEDDIDLSTGNVESDEDLKKVDSPKVSHQFGNSKSGMLSSLKDSHGLANSLMSSLLESSNPTGNVDSNYYQQPTNFYPSMMPTYQEMPINLDFPVMSMQQGQNQWPQNATTSGDYGFPKPHNTLQRRENVNNRQLTGRGRFRK